MERIMNFVCFLFIMFFLIGPANADVYMKQKKHTDGMNIMGQERPATDEMEEIWITAKGIRIDNPKTSMLILIDEKKMVMINHEKKTYSEMPLNMDQIVTEAAKQKGKDTEEVEQGAEANQAMMQGMMKMDVKVQPTNETKKISNWNCKKYNLTMNTFMGIMNMEVWASEELKADKDLYAKFLTTIFSMMPGMQGSTGDTMNEMNKIKGIWVKSISKHQMMGQTMSSSTELLEFKDGTAPVNLMKIPSGYKKTEFMQPEE